MAINKNFVVKNGLQVGTNFVIADASTGKVGIGTSVAQATLEVRGGIAATDLNIIGVGTIKNALTQNLTGTIGTITTLNVDNLLSLNIIGTAATISTATIDNLVGTEINYTYVTILETVGIGTTIPISTLDVRGGIAATDLSVIGIGTIANLNSTNTTITNLTGTAVTASTVNISSTLNSVNGIITSLTGAGLTYNSATFVNNFNSPVGVVTNLTGTAATITNLNSVNGIVTNFTSIAATVTNLNSTSITGISVSFTTLGVSSTFSARSGIITSLTGTGLTYSSGNFTNNINAPVGIITNLTSTNANLSGILTSNTLSIGSTQVLSSNRQLQNISSLDSTTTSAVETAISNTPKTFSDLRITGVSTFIGIATFSNGLQVTSGVTTLGVTTTTNLTSQNLNVTGIATATNLNSTVSDITNLRGTSLSYTGISSLTNIQNTNLNVIGVATIGTLNASTVSISGAAVTNFTVFNNLNVGGISTLPNIRSSSFVGTFATITSANISNLTSTSSTITNLNSTNGTVVNLTGTAATIGNIKIASGIVTATSGVVTYYGDGLYLDNILRGVGVSSIFGIVGYGVTLFNFIGPGISTISVNSGIATLYVSGGGGTFGIIEDTFTVTDATQSLFNLSETYLSGFLDVYLNGIKLTKNDYVESGAYSITLNTPALRGDVLEVVSYKAFSVYTSMYTDFAGIATYASISGISTVSQGLTGTPNISVGIATVSNILNVGTGGTVITTTSDGLVGIGTLNPTDKLSVREGDVSVGISTAHGLILTSPNGTRYRLIVANDGTLSTVSV